MQLQRSDRRDRYFFCGEIKFGSSVEVLVYQSEKKDMFKANIPFIDYMSSTILS